MAKNYKLLYTTLKKNLKNELKIIRELIPKLTRKDEFLDKIKYEGQEVLLDWLFREYIEELEGKKWHNVFLNEEEFKKWKKRVRE